VLHLLAHIYVSRSEALWKEASNLAWFESQLPKALSQLRDPVAFQNREDALSMWDFARDPMDESETMNVPLFVCRHVVCSESTAFVGFLPQGIRNAAVHAFDPLPPSTAISAYNGDYFAGVKISGRGVRGGGGGAGARDMAEGFMERLMDAVQTHPADWQDRVRNALRDMLGQRAYAAIPEEHRQEMIQQVSGGSMWAWDTDLLKRVNITADESIAVHRRGWRCYGRGRGRRRGEDAGRFPRRGARRAITACSGGRTMSSTEGSFRLQHRDPPAPAGAPLSKSSELVLRHLEDVVQRIIGGCSLEAAQSAQSIQVYASDAISST
jgi:hypothetical protein